MRRRLTMILAGLAALAALALGGAAIANATGVGDDGAQLSSSEAARAGAAALRATGGGTVQESERDTTRSTVQQPLAPLPA